MKRISFCIFLFLSVTQISAQTYAIPWAQKQPSWVFPLWFENGDGERDTIYFSYDANAIGWPDDSIFGEEQLLLDTGRFMVYIGCFIDSNGKALKSVALDSSDLFSTQTNGIDICFWKAQLPIILHWDPNLFYSDSLPFPDQDPAPRVQGKLAFDFPMGVFNCSYQYPIYMTDTTLGLDAFVPACVFTDSILFEGSGASYLYFHIEPWTGEFLSVNNLENKPQIDVSFEIEFDQLTIRNNTKQEAHAYLFDCLSRHSMLLGSISAHSFTITALLNIPPGIYLVYLQNETMKSSFKIIKP